ncbi:FBP domain-containing protein [Streptomyces sp. SID2888]|uniref:FBP domain-containing protein n=1 Tax=Streptomyces sp. SID2888 TaxID=2690256 RepID=UPI00136F96FE|nr:FBP domain-containing protein [Streptomyces sp. SID2888]MYV46698.1 FBP domain-containing protein [Streptomyces sp. SID2888]
MKELSEPLIRSSFINCSKGAAQRLPVPRFLPELPWDDLDFLGWRDSAAPERSYIVTEHRGELIGVEFRRASRVAGSHHRSMCSLCLTTHPASGVELMTAHKARSTADNYNTVGTYICSDLSCSLYVRGLKRVQPGGPPKESLSVDEKIQRTKANLAAFLDKLW